MKRWRGVDFLRNLMYYTMIEKYEYQTQWRSRRKVFSQDEDAISEDEELFWGKTVARAKSKTYR